LRYRGKRLLQFTLIIVIDDVIMQKKLNKCGNVNSEWGITKEVVLFEVAQQQQNQVRETNEKPGNTVEKKIDIFEKYLDTMKI